MLAGFRLVCWLGLVTVTAPAQLYVDPNSVPQNVPNTVVRSGSRRCYDRQGAPQRCVPDFVNAAFNRRVHVTNTCGVAAPIEFCVQTGHSGMKKICDVCDDRIPSQRHPAIYLTDLNDQKNETYWMSETMSEDVQYPNMVNLTLSLGKAFSITYVRLKFHSPRPESFAIYKKTCKDCEWAPWQYYSATCRNTYKVPPNAPILAEAQTTGQCSKDYSDISPLTGADVAFSTLEGRPDIHQFEDSAVLQEWVTATDVRVVLNRLNTFGDEVFRAEKVLRSYYYAISDFAVGGRCKCNGHAAECVPSTGQGEDRLVCTCEHNTAGEDCHECAQFYNDRPWRPATSLDANECKACDCNGLSNRCYFDQAMFDETGSGGHCTDCTANTRGAHCQICLENFYTRPRERGCISCNCNVVGSLTLQCDEMGQCPCKAGVDGMYCDRCKTGFYDFSEMGCKDCGCMAAGSHGNQPNCRSDSGDCACKHNVEGRQCDRCKPGYFSLSLDNEFGCTPCFCYGHSSVCAVAPGYFDVNITSQFDKGTEQWVGESSGRVLEVQRADDGAIAISAYESEPSYFIAPVKYLGDIRGAYNKYLTFRLRVSDSAARASQRDIIIDGANGKSIEIPIFAQQNRVPMQRDQEYRFRLHESPDFQWNPRMSSLEFLSVLANVTDLKIRGTYSSNGVGFLSSIQLSSASAEPPSSSLNPVESKVVESCTCPDGFVGQFCEDCAPGYRREPQFGGPSARCIQCECHRHADLCEVESGKCICDTASNTDGHNCEKCREGYYGNARNGTDGDCQACPCPKNGEPENGACMLFDDGDIICTNCPKGYSGRRCERCDDGYFGDPPNGKECKLCDCSGNIHPNGIHNCDTVSGECLRCIHDTHGFHCESCMPGFYGDALLEPKGDCKTCDCYPAGTKKPNADYKLLECNQEDGQCQCLPHVTGRQCNTCQPGYFNMSSGAGCEPCNCDATGSENSTCDIVNGQCRCKPGVTGRRCDMCTAAHFGFGIEGCDPCACESIGSANAQCDVDSGQCECKDNIEGRRCDTCVENMYDLQAGCRDCPPCYGLIQKNVNQHRTKLGGLEQILQDILDNPVPVNDSDFEDNLKRTMKVVDDLAEKVQSTLAGDDSALVNQMENLRNNLEAARKALDIVGQSIGEANATTNRAREKIEMLNELKDRAYEVLDRSKEFLATKGKDAWEKAKEASETYGAQSDQLSKIAQSSRKLADKHENVSAEIEKNAREALNVSRKALGEAKEAIFGSQQTSKEIIILKASYKSAEDMMNETRKEATNQQKMVADALKAAAGTLNEVNQLNLPKVDIEKLQEDAKLITDDAKNAGQQAQQLAADNKELIDEAERVRVAARAELDEAGKAQNLSDVLMDQVYKARDDAIKAVKLAQDTLKEANDTLNTLQEFDALVQSSKNEAIEKMADVENIKELIEEAHNKTQETEMALGSAKTDAGRAEKIAQDAKEMAEEASKKATDILKEAEMTKESSMSRKAEAVTLKGKASEAVKVLGNYKDHANNLKATSNKALEDASKSDMEASKANDTVVKAMDKVKGILDELRSLNDNIEVSQLDLLESQLKEATETLQNAALEEEVRELKAKQAEQQRKINAYKADIDQLEKDVDNIEQIRDSLPQQCFNFVDLENQR